MNKRNYQLELDQLIKDLVAKGERKKLLLHACCAPCSTACIDRLIDYFDITIFYSNDNVAVNAMVSRLMMSTADIIINKNNLPYAVRKQGAGLANLFSSLKTTAYIKTFDNNGKEMDKTKLENILIRFQN